jgi:hypothetical protein
MIVHLRDKQIGMRTMVNGRPVWLLEGFDRRGYYKKEEE